MFEQIIATLTIIILSASFWVLHFVKCTNWEKLFLLATSYLLFFVEMFTILKWLSAEDKTLLILAPIMPLMLKIFLAVWIPLSERSGPEGEYRETYLSLLSYYNFFWKYGITNLLILATTYLQIAIIWRFRAL